MIAPAVNKQNWNTKPSVENSDFLVTINIYIILA